MYSDLFRYFSYKFIREQERELYIGFASQSSSREAKSVGVGGILHDGWVFELSFIGQISMGMNIAIILIL